VTTHLVMTIDSLLPVPLSMAETVRIPLAGTFTNRSDSPRKALHLGVSRLTVNLESDLDLGLTPGSRRNVGQVKLAELVVVLGHRSFTLEHLDRDGRLVVDGGREDLRLLGRYDGVSGAVKGKSRVSREVRV
jgi:hypothetical protein